MTAAVSHLHSIQGEQALIRAATSAYKAMKLDEVDQYVQQASDEVIECRERGRHLYKATRRVGGGGAMFSEVRGGYLIRRLRCGCCGLVERVEKWQTYRAGGQLRYEFVSYTTEYKTGENGERYLAQAGEGRMSPRQVREALVTTALSGMTLTQVKKQAREAGTLQEEK